MNKATLKQANQVLSLISQKDVPSEKLQALFASGLLSDLLEADASKVDREKFRELLDIKPRTCIVRVNYTDKIPLPSGWSIIADAKSPIGILELKLAEFVEEFERYISSDEMLKRAERKGFTLGLRHLEAVFLKQDRIPVEWRTYPLIFPGTVCMDTRGNQLIPFLYWKWTGKWVRQWYCIKSVWEGSGRLVVCA